MNIKDVDLKLLVVFDTVITERNIGRAAQRLGLSQPAVSSAVNRLRRLLKDHLFVRSAGGVKPTPRAVELALPIHDVLLRLQSALEPTKFSPATTTRVFNLAISDHASTLILPTLLALLQKEAPNIHLRVRPKSNVHLSMQLDSGEVDFAIGVIPDPPPRFNQETLFFESYVCVMRKDHPLKEKSFTKADFVAARHLAITHAGDTTALLDRLITKLGIEREIVATANQYVLAPELLRKTDMVLTAFEKLVTTHKSFRGLHVAKCPLPIGKIPINILWHPVLSNRPAHSWLRSKIAEICRSIGTG
jgi:DNA-binding transcriptional LysR family regulator